MSALRILGVSAALLIASTYVWMNRYTYQIVHSELHRIDRLTNTVSKMLYDGEWRVVEPPKLTAAQKAEQQREAAAQARRDSIIEEARAIQVETGVDEWSAYAEALARRKKK